MANNVGNTYQNARLNWVKGTTYPATLANIYVALFTSAPTNAGGGTEVSGGAYARVAIASSGWTALSGNSPASISNSGAVTFAQATANWGTIVAFALMDASSSGNIIYTAAVTTSKPINNGDTAQFAANQITIQED